MTKKPALFLILSLFLQGNRPFSPDITKIELPDMGDSSGTLISPAQEQQLGAAFYRSLHSQIAISQDAEIQQYIEGIGRKLVANSDTPGNPFHFFVVMDNAINAFAGPGGYIGINSGLILTSEAESELASVMAHEIAHVTQRHLYRAFEAASRLSIPTAAATLAAILIGTQSPELAQAAIMAVQAGSIQFQIDFTRDNEQEADRVGMQTLAASNFDPRSMPIFFERLQQSSRYYGRGVPEFLRTHPVTSSRISDTRGRAEKYPYQQYPDSMGYLLTRAKLRVLSANDYTPVLNYFKPRLSQGTQQQRAVARYGTGLVHLNTRNFQEAERIFKALTQEYREQPQFATAYARSALEAQNFSNALARYQAAMQQFPGNQAIKLETLSALLKSGNPEQARQILQMLDASTKRQPVYFKLLAQIYSDLKQPAESHRYLAEYYYAMGQTDAAITQIKLAQKSPGINYYLSAILNERLVFFIREEEQRKRNQ
ncbi:beta-barrel assembly-enhancing protease [Methylotuvimicrobium alcaliphilum]|uniref:Putative beta-barrel assembly-enhancing protease n=1 Tax=Methylotuvimicrobium alcaliphilum (strain DSM 19304 / NCIMB 14124 / VKM B-2133 / 20Z) TaxID=1091494 RepID=G4T3S0_META2|nr:M48 family metalloprotease [Methylotuvimicrobium alcaliphilum]CCE24876.1 Peptidase M48 Ste24p [Methylotuvimicrobium alcaliphilum 20Z]